MSAEWNDLLHALYVWVVDGVELFCYQTGQGAPTISSVNLEIYTANPTTGGAPFPGSPGLANNLFTTTGYSVTNTMTNDYRVVIGTLGDAARRIQSVQVTFPAPLVLPQGQYWLEFRFGSSVAGSVGPFVPPITVLGSPVTGGTSYQRIFTIAGGTSTFPALIDVSYAQGLPFKLLGSPTSLPGAITNLGGASVIGPTAVTLDVRGAPHIGGVVHSALTNTNPVTFPL